ncbi:vacuolar protein [Kwoniella mangroviensis CBS 10435]|uniref:Vacuolar protein n=1 Tax=Kwoniella mangroviensis CBS 10435 TaxID=1331196 RepID=A0A1B9J188_9TREE|nr:vacuolar protein [Kwoniella mangroviensis CBS 8507]OCF61538.1 vacuolar protein [Kwoniella mangroviensis CBS 10435]OCF63391.1 vacuolar protein [Kwoniella mangroviensis CBS 8507]OCF77562.1 vacuolar protein [Kwoniella mangroviensis CBS 8886]
MSAPPQYTDNPQAGPLPPKKSYGAAPTDGDVEATEPLLATAQASTSAQRTGNAWMDEGSSDDFKVGVNVIDCDTEIRLAFIRKVYSILFLQLLLTSVVSLGMSYPKVSEFTKQNSWIIWIPLIGSMVSLFMVYWKRHHHPANLILLGIFTLFEAMSIGFVTSMVEGRIVLQALFLTLGVFAGLTLFTFQTKFDFSSLAPFLFVGIWGLITASLVQIFLPFNANVDLGIACFSTLLFAGFVLYDTQQIMKRLSVDEAILGALTLYLDFLNLFLSILRILNNQNNR